MKTRFISVLLLILAVLSVLTACENEEDGTAVDYSIINNNEIKVGLMLSKEEAYTSSSVLLKQGVDYTHLLASDIIIGKRTGIKLVEAGYYSDEESIDEAVNTLINEKVAAVIFDGADFNSAKLAVNKLETARIPVITPSNYISVAGDLNSAYSLGIQPTYEVSCVSAYATEKGYSKIAVITDEENEYSKLLKDAFSTNANLQTTFYFTGGDSANFNSSTVSAAGCDLIYIDANADNTEKTLSDLNTSGNNSKVLLAEAIDYTALNKEEFSSVSFISKFTADSKNNVNTIFISGFSEFSSTQSELISPASSYGYDSYMMIFEALRTYSTASNKPILGSATEASTDSNSQTITPQNISDAIRALNYYGTMGNTVFDKNFAKPDTIYICNITASKVNTESKYIFD